MSEMNKIGYGRAISALLIVLVGFLVGADYLILSYQRSLLTTEAIQHARNEMRLFGTLSREALLKRDYITVRLFLNQFAAEQSEIRVLKAVTPQHFILAEYRDSRPTTIPLSVRHEVLVDDQPLLVLEMVKDFGYIEKTLRTLMSRLIIISVLLATALGLSLWYLLKSIAIKPLEKEIDVRRQAEETARQSEARFRQLSEATFEGVGVVQDGKVLDVNQQMADILGYQVSELISLPVQDIVAPQSRQLVMANIQAGYEGLYEYFLMHRDGSLVPCESRARMMKWQGKDARVTIVRDLTERKQAEYQLQENEERLRTINNNLAFGMIYQSITLGDGTRRFTYLSDNVQRFYGITPSQGLADANLIYSRMHEDDCCLLLQKEEESLRNLTTFKSEVRVLDPQGSIRWSYLVSAPRKLDNGSICWDGIEFDITERKETEILLNRKNKMESMGTLAAGIAHDFNNVLHIINANLEIARREPMTSTLSQTLAVLTECEQRGAGLVQQILRFSRQSSEEKGTVVLEQLIRETVQLLKADRLFDKVTLDQQFEAEPVPLLADEQEMRQLVSNLLLNACQSLEEQGGHITVTLSVGDHVQAVSVYDGQLKPGRYQRLTVADNGCGIDDAIMARLFEPFFTTREKSGGTGLGLAIVHGIVRANGGGITVESTLGLGTTFHLYFPLLEESLKKTARAVAAVSSSFDEPVPVPMTRPLLCSSEITILFVDDEPLNIDNWSALLALEGFAVQGFTSGAEALEVFKKEPTTYSILLTDLRMPGMSGSELAEAIRQIRPELPILFSSGWIGQEMERTLNDLGNSAVLSKPHAVKTLVFTILDLCSHGVG